MIVLAYGVYEGIPIEPSDWNLFIGVFGGTTIVTSLAMGVSERFDWYEVDTTGLAYRAPGGIGGARLVMKTTSRVAWGEIVDVTRSRWLPFACLSLRIERPDAEGAARFDSLALPLYLREQEHFHEELSVHAPEGHPLKRALSAQKLD